MSRGWMSYFFVIGLAFSSGCTAINHSECISGDFPIPLPAEGFTGLWTTWYPGKQQKASEGYYKNRKRHGTQIWWHSNGQIRCKMEMVDDRLHGKEIEWEPDGRIWREEQYKHGKPHGVSRIWWTNGRLREERYYRNGKYHGTVKKWNEKGVLLRSEVYENGVLIQRVLCKSSSVPLTTAPIVKASTEVIKTLGEDGMPIDAKSAREAAAEKVIRALIAQEANEAVEE